MTAVEHWVPLPNPVEALPLDGPADLQLAECWLRAHGLPTVPGHPSAVGRAVVVPGRRGFVARLGQVLCHDTVTGEFRAVDDAVFRGSHDQRPANVKRLPHADGGSES